MSEALYRWIDGHDALAPLLDGAGDEELLVRLGRPTLVRLPGREPGRAARLVCTLLHGNEDSGYRAVLRLLRRRPVFDFPLWLFIGNVRAAHEHGWFAHRYLDDQEDFNRVWGLPAAELTTRQRRVAAAVLERVTAEPLEAALDIHNNTGANPPYALVPVREQRTESLAATCSETVVFWNRRVHALMEALAPHCPAVSVECGMPGIEAHHRYAEQALARFLQCREIAAAPPPERAYELIATVWVRPEVTFAFGGVLEEPIDFVLVPGLDGHNFSDLPAGTVLGYAEPGTAMPLCAEAMDGRDVTERYFAVEADGAIVLRTGVVPAMMVTTVQQARRDCLCYLARRLR